MLFMIAKRYTIDYNRIIIVALYSDATWWQYL